MKHYFLLGVICSITILSCNNKEPKQPTPSSYLTQGKWKLVSAQAAGGLLDLMSSMKDCQKDNYYIFNTNNSITINEGANKCNDSAKQEITQGTWTLSNNDAKISINGTDILMGVNSLTADITTLNFITLQVKKDTVVSSYPTSVILTFTNVK